MNKGQAALTVVVFFVFITLAMTTGLAALSLKESGIQRIHAEAKRSYFVAEAGVEDVAYRIATGKNVSAEEVLVLDGRPGTTTTSQLGSVRTVTAVGDAATHIRKIVARVVETSDAQAISFYYGAHVGTGGLEMESNAVVNGNVHSNGNITGSSNTVINGNASAVGTISSPRPTVTGTKTSGAATVPFPVVDLNYWRNAANVNSDPIVGNYTLGGGTGSFGPKKVQGNFTLNSNASFTVTGPIHITGNFAMNSNTHLYLDESFGNSGTVIVVDGSITFNSNAAVHTTSASPKGYILFATPSTSGSAVAFNSNSTVASAFYAPNGTMEVESNGDVVSITVRKLELESNAEINYDTGLQNATFASGPGGGIVISGWQESE